MNRPRILIVTRKFWPQVGATQRALGRLVWKLGDYFDITMVTAFAHPHWPRRLEYGPARVDRIYKTPTGWFSMRGAMRTLTKYISDAKPAFDLIYTLRMRDESAAVVKALGDKIPTVIRAEYSGLYGDCYPLSEDRRSETIRRQCTSASRMIATSPSVASEVAAAGFPRGRIVEIPCDAYLPLTQPDDDDFPAILPDDPPEVSIERRQKIRDRMRESLAEIDAQLQTPDRMRVVACIEQWQDPEVFDFLLELALKMAAGPGRSVRFWLIGDRPLQPWVIRRMNEGEVRALFAFIPLADNIGPLLAASDAVIVPSCGRFSPLSLLEAVQSHTPLVCVNRPEIKAIVGEPEDHRARFFPEEDITSAMSTLEAMIDDSKAADAFARAAGSMAAERFGLARSVEKHVALFQELLEGD